VQPDDRVALCVERGLEMVVGLLAILKAGGAYVPLDPAYPHQRLAFMLEDSGAEVLLTQRRLARNLPTEAIQVMYLDEAGPVLAAQPDTNLDAGKSFLTNVLAKLPEHLRAQAQAAFEAADASAALEEAGRGYKSLSETSRLADEAKATRERAEALYNQNRAWYEANSAEVQAAAALRAKVAALESGKPADGQPPLPDANAGPKYVRDEDFRATVAESVGLFAVTVPRLARRRRGRATVR
jgi:acyl-CoA synthetase (AMP-forming)/AMP-acid ligase II